MGIDLVKIDWLHPFGCLTWFEFPEASQNKLDPKGRQSVLLLYLLEGKRYCLWDIASKEFIKSRDVLFDQEVFPYQTLLPAALVDSEPVWVDLPWPNHHYPNVVMQFPSNSVSVIPSLATEPPSDDVIPPHPEKLLLPLPHEIILVVPLQPEPSLPNPLSTPWLGFHHLCPLLLQTHCVIRVPEKYLTD